MFLSGDEYEKTRSHSVCEICVRSNGQLLGKLSMVSIADAEMAPCLPSDPFEMATASRSELDLLCQRSPAALPPSLPPPKDCKSAGGGRSRRLRARSGVQGDERPDGSNFAESFRLPTHNLTEICCFKIAKTLLSIAGDFGTVQHQRS